MSERIVLVTGGAGYIGSRLVRDLAADPDIDVVRIFDNMQAGRYGALADLPAEGRFQLMEGDIMDPAAVRSAMEGVDAVVHLAALVRTPFSFDYPTWTEHVNHWGTTRLVEHCLEAGVRRFIFASSASVYGPGDGMDETQRCAPIGPYSRSKLGAEGAVLAAGDRGLEPVVLRIATVFGYAPAMRFDAVPNRFAYLAAIGRSLPVHGTGEQLRPLVHVSDACQAIHTGVQRDDMAGQVYNVVAANVSVADMAEAARELRPFSALRYTAQDVLTRFSLSLDGERLGEIGWEGRTGLVEGLDEVLKRFGNFEPYRAPVDEMEA